MKLYNTVKFLQIHHSGIIQEIWSMLLVEYVVQYFVHFQS